MKLRLGTRGSALARAQAADVARRLEACGHEVEIVILSTVGDRVTDRAFTDVGSFGVFVREIEAALLDGRLDLAVHSYKDLPSKSPEGLVIAAVPERVDPADVLLIQKKAYTPFDRGLPLRPGARVGTSAARRSAMLLDARPDLAVGLLRGNVPTRIRALVEDRFDAIVLAVAGLQRLARAGEDLGIPDEVVRVRLDPYVFVPAPSQGAIAVQARADDYEAREAAAMIHDPDTEGPLAAERELLRLAEAGCNQPFGAWCERRGSGLLLLVAALGSPDGHVHRAEATGSNPRHVAADAWAELAGVVA